MAKKQLRELRHKYRDAYTAYLSHVQALFDASKEGAWPGDDVMVSEGNAFRQMDLFRQLLVDALVKHCSSVERTSN
jgi:hypothetical protein